MLVLTAILNSTSYLKTAHLASHSNLTNGSLISRASASKKIAFFQLVFRPPAMLLAHNEKNCHELALFRML